MAPRNVRFFHLQSVSPPANMFLYRIVQHTKLPPSLFAGAVLALWCLVLFNDCVQALNNKTSKYYRSWFIGRIRSPSLAQSYKGFASTARDFQPLRASVSQTKLTYYQQVGNALSPCYARTCKVVLHALFSAPCCRQNLVPALDAHMHHCVPIFEHDVL